MHILLWKTGCMCSTRVDLAHGVLQGCMHGCALHGRCNRSGASPPLSCCPCARNLKSRDLIIGGGGHGPCSPPPALFSALAPADKTQAAVC